MKLMCIGSAGKNVQFKVEGADAVGKLKIALSHEEAHGAFTVGKSYTLTQVGQLVKIGKARK